MSFTGRLFGSSQPSCSGLAQNCDRQTAVNQAFTCGQKGRTYFQSRLPHRLQESRKSVRGSNQIVSAGNEEWLPPTVADTKRKFYESYSKPLPAIYNSVIQEFLVAQHLIRYNKKYQYDEVFALGFISIFDQVLEGAQALNEDVLTAYLQALDEDSSKYRADSEKLASWAKGLSGFEDVKPNTEGTEVQKLLAGIAARSKEDNFLYSKFFAIGLFRLLELTGAKDPKALGSLVEAMHLRKEAVNRDLLTYKNVLSKLSAAKELMKEILDRDRKKQAEREAEKKALAEGAKSNKEEEKTTAGVTSEKPKANA